MLWRPESSVQHNHEFKSRVSSANYLKVKGSYFKKVRPPSLVNEDNVMALSAMPEYGMV